MRRLDRMKLAPAPGEEASFVFRRARKFIHLHREIRRGADCTSWGAGAGGTRERLRGGVQNERVTFQRVLMCARDAWCPEACRHEGMGTARGESRLTLGTLVRMAILCI